MGTIDRGTNPAFGLARRRLLQGTGLLAVSGAVGAGWLPVFKIPVRGARATLAPPSEFPRSIRLYQQAYQSWSGEVLIQNLWTAAPRSPGEVLQRVNWAASLAMLDGDDPHRVFSNPFLDTLMPAD